MSQRVLVAGATGRLGRELVRHLKAQGYYVRALARDEARLQRFCPLADERLVVDVVKTEDLSWTCEGMDHVVSCVGASVIPSLRQGRKSFTEIDIQANLRLMEAASKNGVRRFVYLAVFTDGRLQENDFVRGHEEVVKHLRTSGLEYAVVRPTGFFAPLVKIMSDPSWGLIPEHRKGQARTNPIHEADLAAFCVEVLQSEERRGEYSVGGPEVLTRRQIAELVWRENRNNHKGVRVPVTSLRAASFLLRPFNRRVSQLMYFIAEVLSDDYVAPTYGTRTFSHYLQTEAAIPGSGRSAD